MTDTVERGRIVDGAVLWEGSLGPTAGSPRRAPGSIRRTSTVDIRWPEGVGGVLELDGRARDLRTDAEGRGHVLAAASTHVVVEGGEVRALETEPAVPSGPFVGTEARRFRRAVEAHAPGLATDGSLLGLLLDEIPVAALIAGHAYGRTGITPPGAPAEGTPRRSPALDICTGWASGGFMARRVALGGPMPQFHDAVVVPPLTDPDDPLAWHEMPVSLPPTSLRRNRRLDIVRTEAGSLAVEGIFRDQYHEADGRVTGVHEYAIAATVDPDGTLLAIEASPRVLPGPDCPGAAASAQRLVGRSLREIRALVRSEFAGTSTCTHLNDELRAVGDLHALVGGL